MLFSKNEYIMKYMSTYHLLTDDKRLKNRFIVALFNIIIATFSKEKKSISPLGSLIHHLALKPQK